MSTSGLDADVSASNDMSTSKTILFLSDDKRTLQIAASNDVTTNLGRDAFIAESSTITFSSPTTSPTMAYTISSTSAETEVGALSRAADLTPTETSGSPADVAASNDVSSSSTVLFGSGSERKLEWAASNDNIRKNAFSFESAPLIISTMSPSSAPTSAAESDDAIKLLSTDVTDDFLVTTTDIATTSVQDSEEGPTITVSNDVGSALFHS
jgi:hypothetical protein